MKKLLGILTTALALATFQAQSQNLVQNGDFATGTFADWTLSGNVSWDSILSFHPPLPGTTSPYVACLGPNPPPIDMSQTIATTIGDSYTFSFYVSRNGDVPGTGPVGPGLGGSEFTASFGGSQVFDSVDTAIPNWTLESFSVVATGPSTVVEFTSVSPPGDYFVGDISVTDAGRAKVPEVGSTVGMLGAAMAGLALLRRKLA